MSKEGGAAAEIITANAQNIPTARQGKQMNDDGLSWAIKRSFARYITHLPDGRLSLKGGARATAGDQLFFPLRSVATEVNHLAFEGHALFSGHMGLLAVSIGNPSVEFALAARSGRLLTEQRGVLCLFATFLWDAREHAGGHILTGTNVQLAVDSVPLFGGSYVEGEMLEDFTIVSRGPFLQQ